MEGVSLHLILDGYYCDKQLLADQQLISNMLDALPQRIGMKKISAPHVMRYDGGDVPQDWGITGFVLIAESHISIHTFPEKESFFLDVFSCREFAPGSCEVFVKDCLAAKFIYRTVLTRGKYLGW